MQYVVMDAKAKELGVELTDADKTKIASTLKSDMTEILRGLCHRDDFAAYLKTIYMTRDYYDFVNKIASVLRYLRQDVRHKRREMLRRGHHDLRQGKRLHDRRRYIFISRHSDDSAALTGDALTAKETLANKAGLTGCRASPTRPS